MTAREEREEKAAAKSYIQGPAYVVGYIFKKANKMVTL